MRSLVILLFVALAATGCQGTRQWIDDRALLQREQEMIRFEEQRKQAILDLSGYR